MRKEKNVNEEGRKALALSVFAETGSTKTAAARSGVARRTIQSWIDRDPDIDSKLEELRRAVRENVAHLYVEGARVAAEVMLDRLEKGDPTYVNGELKRRPVSAKDAAYISGVCTDKHANLTGSVSKRAEEKEVLTKLVERLVSEFEARRKKRSAIDAQVIEGETATP